MAKCRDFVKFLFSALCFSIFASVSMAQVSLNPIYAPERFQPSDKFHAGCENQIDVVFDLPKSNINGVNAILVYDGSQIDILNVLADGEKENNLTYTVENDKITFNKLKTDSSFVKNVTFRIRFKVNSSVEKSVFSRAKGSYVLDSKGSMVDIVGDYEFSFAQVPECDPDIVAPSVSWLFPAVNTGEYIALDSYFQWEISDQGKGINSQGIKIIINGFQYDLTNIENEWSGNILTVYPGSLLPFNTGFIVEINVPDKQVYGKANITKIQHEFFTNDELNLLNEMDPVKFRKLIEMEKNFQGSKQECDLLALYYSKASLFDRKTLTSINTKLNCADFDVNLLENLDNLGGDDTDISDIPNILDHSSAEFSVFAVLGWLVCVLFVLLITFYRLSKGETKK